MSWARCLCRSASTTDSWMSSSMWCSRQSASPACPVEVYSGMVLACGVFNQALVEFFLGVVFVQLVGRSGWEGPWPPACSWILFSALAGGFAAPQSSGTRPLLAWSLLPKGVRYPGVPPDALSNQFGQQLPLASRPRFTKSFFHELPPLGDDVCGSSFCVLLGP